jgi:integrase
MLDELQRRNYSQSTTRCYLHAVEDFARYFHRSPYRLGPDHIRQYQAHLFRDRKLLAGTITLYVAALRFLYVKTLRRPYLHEHILFPKRPRQLPVVLSPEEVEHLIDSAENLMRRTMVMTLYATGVRCSELCHLKVSDIDSRRMVIHVRKGKGGRDRDVLLSPKLLGTLREYWRWMKPKTYLFPGTVNNWRADVPITPKVVWKAVNEAGKRAGIGRRVGPHLLRHYAGFRTIPGDRRTDRRKAWHCTLRSDSFL